LNLNFTQKLTRTAVLLTVTLVLQGLRIILPMPPQTGMFIIGSLVNTCLVLAVLLIGWKPAVIVACMTPLFAWLEGMLPFLPFIIPVAVGNIVFVTAVFLFRPYHLTGWVLAVCLKCVSLCGAFYLLFSIMDFPPFIRASIFLMMSWPQLVTASMGILLALAIAERIQKRYY
jgi:hypothetical protein